MTYFLQANGILFWRHCFLLITLLFQMRVLSRTHYRACSSRRGAAAMDYMLILAAMLPIVLFIVTKGKRVMQLVWEMLCVQISWPLM